MARLLGVEIPNEKRIEASLPYIYGIGPTTAKKVLEQAGIDPNIRTGQLSDEQLSQLVQLKLKQVGLSRLNCLVITTPSGGLNI